jgi:acetyl esterase
MLIEKNIPLSNFEREQREKSKGASWLAWMPLPLMKWFVLRNIESLRYPKDIVMPVISDSSKKINYTRHELDGSPKKVGLSVFQPAGDHDEKLPLFFFIHGGGFLGGDSRMNEGLLRHLADTLNIRCAAVDYNVAPEVTHPVPLEDCSRAYNFVLAHYATDETRIFLAGDSAGGNLAAALTLKLSDEGGPIPKGQILLYPVTDLYTIDKPSYRKKGLEYQGMRKGIRLSQNLYVPDKTSRKHPYVSPACANMTHPQPDALLLIPERDGLRSDGIEYAEKLEKAGGYSRCVLYKGAYHSFINDLFRSGIADDAAEEILEFIQKRLVI